MKNKIKLTVILGLICAALMALSSWYTIAFNEARFIKPMDLVDYSFRPQDLPMLISGALLAVYVLYLVVLVLKKAAATQQGSTTSRVTRTINPKLGFLGLLGFLGFLGFWTYRDNQMIFPFVFFVFFGFFGFFYEGKMSNTLMDERYIENKLKAQNTANKTTITILFVALLVLGQGRFLGSLEYTLIALVITVALVIALGIFLSEYLLYRYDKGGQLDESEE